jgi:hypothetical protein
VWKEKSKLKTAGLLICRDTEVISKTSQLKIYTSNSLLNVPQLDPEGLRKLYSELGLGKKPAEIIAEHGFHPELVENEYQRYLRLREYDVSFLLKKFLLHFKQELLTTNNDTIISLREKYGKDRRLTIDECITLISSLINEKYRLGKVSAIHDLIDGIVPEGWQSVLCLNCNKPITGCMDNVTMRSRIRISDNSMPLTHPSLRISCV